jgi:hypothetical protein
VDLMWNSYRGPKIGQIMKQLSIYQQVMGINMGLIWRARRPLV